MMCGCGGKCHCMVGEISAVYSSMEEAYENAVAILEDLEKADDAAQIAALETEYMAAWEDIGSCESELGQSVNEFNDGQEYNEWYYGGSYTERRRIYRIAQ